MEQFFVCSAPLQTLECGSVTSSKRGLPRKEWKHQENFYLVVENKATFHKSFLFVPFHMQDNLSEEDSTFLWEKNVFMAGSGEI